VLQLLVPPAVTADLGAPAAGVGRRPGRAVELVRPGQRPAGRLVRGAVAHRRLLVVGSGAVPSLSPLAP
jgi:hypothetical protein